MKILPTLLIAFLAFNFIKVFAIIMSSDIVSTLDINMLALSALGLATILIQPKTVLEEARIKPEDNK